MKWLLYAQTVVGWKVVGGINYNISIVSHPPPHRPTTYAIFGQAAGGRRHLRFRFKFPLDTWRRNTYPFSVRPNPLIPFCWHSFVEGHCHYCNRYHCPSPLPMAHSPVAYHNLLQLDLWRGEKERTGDEMRQTSDEFTSQSKCHRQNGQPQWENEWPATKTTLMNGPP